MALKIVQGADQNIAITLLRKDACGISLPENLTGKTLTVKYKNASNVLVTKTGPTDVTVLDATYGKLSLNLSDTDTDALATGDFNFDVYVDDAGDITIWKFEGKIEVLEKIA